MEKGIKQDQGKLPLELIPEEPLDEVARVMGFGASKYGRDNWRGGMKWSRLIGAAKRHLSVFNRGIDIDPESNLPHLAHAACCVLFLLEYMRTHKELDDRWKGDKNG